MSPALLHDGNVDGPNLVQNMEEREKEDRMLETYFVCL